jgi:hypothetical protein
MSEQHNELRIEDWQRIVAKGTPVRWTGELSDDVSAEWAGLRLRAEWMDGSDWWWSVYDVRTETEIASSNRNEDRYESGEAARQAAETAARWFIGVT